MQLVVHLSNVEKVVVDGKKKIFNTFKYNVKSEEEGKIILSELEASGKKISKSSFCGDPKTWGRPFKNQSK